MKKISKRIALMCLLPLALSCNQFEDHSNDGLYAGLTMAGAVAWVIDGNDVTIYTMGMANKDKIEHGDGYVRLRSTGVMMLIERDSVSGEKSLVLSGLLLDTKLVQISTRTDFPAAQISEVVSSALTGRN